MSQVPEEIIGEINQLYYDLKKIESIQDYRNQLASSDLKTALSLIKNVNSCKKEVTTFKDFLKQLPENEKGLALLLLDYGKILHCQIIGNKGHGARQHWERIYKWVVEEIKRYKEPQCTFMIFSFATFSLALFLINDGWKLTSLYNLSIFLLTLLLTILAGIWSKALVISEKS